MKTYSKWSQTSKELPYVITGYYNETCIVEKYHHRGEVGQGSIALCLKMHRSMGTYWLPSKEITIGSTKVWCHRARINIYSLQHTWF